MLFLARLRLYLSHLLLQAHCLISCAYLLAFPLGLGQDSVLAI